LFRKGFWCGKKCDKLGKVPEAIEAMTGVPLHLYDRETLLFNIQQRTLVYRDNPKDFYEGFPAVDN